MHLSLSKRFEVPENWFAGILFPFKLFTLGAAVWLLIWYMMLPANLTTGDRIDQAFFMAINDFDVVAGSVWLLHFISACVLVVGGFVQLFKYSRHAALWSIGFGILAFVIGIVLVRVCDSLPSHYEYLRSVA